MVAENREWALAFVSNADTARLRGRDTLPTIAALIAEAKVVSDYLEEPPRIVRLRVGFVRDQSTGVVSTQPVEGTTMQLRDTQQVDYAVTEVDAKGYAVDGGAFTATSDTEAVVTVVQNGSTFTAVAGGVGSAVLTFSDGTISITEAIDVVAGDAATIAVTAGAVSEQVPPVAPVTP
jgi:hypothetical protein